MILSGDLFFIEPSTLTAHYIRMIPDFNVISDLFFEIFYFVFFVRIIFNHLNPIRVRVRVRVRVKAD